MNETPIAQPFLTDVTTLRERARQNIEKGAVTFTYQGDVSNTIELLQSVLATEIVCVLRYTMHAVAAAGISSEGVKDEFKAHAREEAEHVKVVAERINQLGGKPNFDPTGLASRSASEYRHARPVGRMKVLRCYLNECPWVRLSRHLRGFPPTRYLRQSGRWVWRVSMLLTVIPRTG